MIGDDEFIGIHMMISRRLIASLDKHKTRYQSRTSLVVKAIEQYLIQLEIQEGLMENQGKLDWISFRDG